MENEESLWCDSIQVPRTENKELRCPRAGKDWHLTSSTESSRDRIHSSFTSFVPLGHSTIEWSISCYPSHNLILWGHLYPGELKSWVCYPNDTLFFLQGRTLVSALISGIYTSSQMSPFMFGWVHVPTAMFIWVHWHPFQAALVLPSNFFSQTFLLCETNSNLLIDWRYIYFFAVLHKSLGE